MSKREIPLSEIDFHPLSFCDHRGRLFWWRGELYRGIRSEYARFYASLAGNGVVQRLIERKHVVETTIADLATEEFPIILRHRAIHPVSYAHEWCPEMLRDAGLLVANTMIELLKQDLLLSGANTWGVVFDGCTPTLVDFCDIVPLDADTRRRWGRFVHDFHSYFLQPLQLMAEGKGDLARWLFADYEHDSIHRQFNELLQHRREGFASHVLRQISNTGQRIVPSSLRKNVHGYRTPESRDAKPVSPTEMIRGTEGLRRELESIHLPRTSINGESFLSATSSEGWTDKQRAVCECLRNLQPETVLDLGSDQGWYSHAAASLGSTVVAVDRDERKSSACYRNFRNSDSHVLPVVMDIRHPSPGLGVCNEAIAPASQRFSCDMVLALALVHQLALDQHLTFEQIVATLTMFSKRWILVEFVPAEDDEISSGRTHTPAWYTFDNFIRALNKRFHIVRTMKSSPSNRLLVLGEKKNLSDVRIGTAGGSSL